MSLIINQIKMLNSILNIVLHKFYYPCRISNAKIYKKLECADTISQLIYFGFPQVSFSEDNLIWSKIGN